MKIRTGLLLGGLLAACSRPLPPLPAPAPIPSPAPPEVERVYFLVGDPGEARSETSPILHRLQQDIEWWAGQLRADSAVTMFVLGDMLYPAGLHERGTPEFPSDSAIVVSQVEMVAGQNARDRGARAYFLPGNHDWGLREDWEGFIRVARLNEFLRAAGESLDANVQLAPAPGTGGPFVLDDAGFRFILLDTAWWLFMADEAAMDSLITGIDQAMIAGDREVIFLAHHPFHSAGKHAGQVEFWKTFGIQYILSRSGAILQDLTSVPYRKLQHGLRETFARRGVPLAFVGGHDHSLQVIEGVVPTDPRYSLVSGSVSKLSGVGRVPGLRYGISEPGYIRLVKEKNGGVSIFVEATPAEYQTCPAEDPQRATCMAAGVASFRTVHSQRLR